MLKDELDKKIFEEILSEEDDLSVEESLQSEITDYDEIEKAISKYFKEHGNEIELQKEIQKSEIELEKKRNFQKKISRSPKLFKVCSSLVATILIIIIGNYIIVGATNYNLLGNIIEYGNSVLKINLSSNEANTVVSENTQIYQELKEKCESYGFSPLLPKVTPENMVSTIDLQNNSIKIKLANKSNQININVLYYKDNSNKQDVTVPLQNDVSIVKNDNLTFYISRASSWYNVTFADGNYSYILITNIPYENLKKVLFSFQN